MTNFDETKMTGLIDPSKLHVEIEETSLQIQVEIQSSGPQGEPGVGIEIIGSLETIDDLPSTGSLGAGYLIEGDLWVWTEDGYENVGHIQGPKGDKGERGPEGPVGPIGTSNYTDLSNRPSIESIELIGNKTFEDLGIISITKSDIINIF